MIDIHAHILPDLDDGPANEASALEMARQALLDGITTVIATPHVHSGELDDAEINARVTRLRGVLLENNIPLEIKPGAEVAFDGLDLARLNLLNEGPYVLIEFPHAYIPAEAEEVLHALRHQGLYPIIAHPERNGGVIRNPESLFHLLGDDIFLQITAASLTGILGSAAQHCALYLLRKGFVHFLATDCHSPKHRKPELAVACKVAAKIVGKQQAVKLVRDNPLAVVRGTRLLH